MAEPLTPERIAKAGTEHALQAAFFCALKQAPIYLKGLPQTDWELAQYCFAIPSGGHRDAITAGRLKAEGVRPGVPDTCLPVARGPYISLWIEFKKPHRQKELNGGMSTDQVRYKNMLTSQRHCVTIAYGWEHAVEILRWYLQLR